MSSFLQTSDGDLAIVNARLQVVTGATEKAQKINDRLRLFLGEWFLDTRVGMPWYQVVFVKDPDLDVIRRLFRKVILSVEGIVDVQELTLDWDRAGRLLSWSFVALDDEGTEIDGATQTPLILGVN